MPLRVHFLNVGQGDCTIIEFPSGRVGMVDIANLKVLDPDTRIELTQEIRETSAYTNAERHGVNPLAVEAARLTRAQERLTNPLDYYDTQIGRERQIFRMMITHPHMDHMTGLYELQQDWWRSIANFWHTGFDNFDLDSSTDTEWNDSLYDKRDWEAYKDLRASTGSSPTSLQKYQGATGDYWSEDGIEIWAPTQELVRLAVERNDQNILSMVLKISHAGRSVLLGGDATADETWPTIYPHLDMRSVDILKASHHGRKSGYYWPAVEEMSPWLTITSVGEKAHDATENYRRYSDYTASLRKTEDISITIEDNGSISYPSELEDHWKPKRT